MELEIFILFFFFLLQRKCKSKAEASLLDYAEMQPFFVFCTKIRRKPMLVKQIISIFA